MAGKRGSSAPATRSRKRQEQVDIQQIWELYHQTRDETYRNMLMEHYEGLVRYTAERMRAKLSEKVELDDLISAGVFGLIDAIEAFDPKRGVKFETYCTPRIKGAMLDELRNMDWVPRLVRSRAHQFARAMHTLELNLGRKPVDEELARELNVDMDEFNKLQREVRSVGVISLSNRCNEDEGDKDICEIDIIKDQKSQDPLLEAQKKDIKELLTRGLTRAERLIVVLYYYEEMTMKEIGATLDLSESRVSQMHSSIMARLKAHLHDRKREFS